MAVIALTDTQSCANFFQRRVLINLHYWRDYLAVNTEDVAALDREQSGIIRAISFALDLDEAWSAVYKLIVTFSPYMERRGYWETWNWVLSRAIEAARWAEDVGAEANLSALLARLLQRQSRFKEAIACYRRTIRLARRSGDRFNEARSCSNLGYLYLEQGYWHRAEVLCRHALTIFEQIGSDHGRAHTENHLGILYTRQCLWDKARLHLERACALWGSMSDDHGLMLGFINLGLLYNEMECPAKALHYLDKSLQQAGLTGEEALLGTIYLNMGYAYKLNGEPAQTEIYARQAEAIFRRFSNSLYLPLAWINLGEACLDQGRWHEACLHLEAALEACRQSHNKYGEIKALMGMVEYNLAVGNHQKVSEQLPELEQLVRQNSQDKYSRQFETLLTKFRRSLTGASTRQAAAY
jgi:tetratricopeptide (TPR) repeat protein